MITPPPPPPRVQFHRGRYYLDGQPVPRVTSILAVVAKPGLTDWMLRVGQAEADRLREEGAALGTAVHAAIEAVNTGRMPVVTGPAGMDLTAYADRYHAWKEATVREVVRAEYAVFHETHRYAGTLDMVAELYDGRRALVDFKTNKSPDAMWGLQLAAYAAALEAMGEPVDVWMVLHFPSGDGGQVLRVIEYPDHRHHDQAWRACVRLHRYLEQHRDDWRTQKGYAG